MAIRKYGIPEKPNSSHAINSEAIGQLVTPQKTADSPIAAAKAGGRPKREPATQPKVAPTKKARHNLAALIAKAESHGRQKNF